MTSRGQEKRDQWEAYKKNNNIDGYGGGGKMVLSIISIVIAGAALAMSIVAACLQAAHADREYEYKLNAELEIMGSPRINIEQIGEERLGKVEIDKIQIRVLEKNNLQSVFLIDANDNVTRLTIDEVDSKITTSINESTEVVVDEVEFVTSKSQNPAAAPSDEHPVSDEESRTIDEEFAEELEGFEPLDDAELPF